MIAKIGKRKQDNGNYQLLYKQIDDAIFAKIYLAAEVVGVKRFAKRFILCGLALNLGSRCV